MGKGENDVKKSVMEILEVLKVKAWNTQSGMVKVKGGYMHLASKNTSDIIGFLPHSGRILAIEAKRKGKLPTSGQVKFLADINKAGGVGLVVDDVDRFKVIIKDVLKDDLAMVKKRRR